MLAYGAVPGQQCENLGLVRGFQQQSGPQLAEAHVAAQLQHLQDADSVQLPMKPQADLGYVGLLGVLCCVLVQQI